MAGFSYRYRLSGGAPAIKWMKLKDGESVDQGDMVAASTAGTIAVATSAAGASQLWGAATGTKAESTGSYVHVVTDWDAVYAVTDATARYAGDTLTIDSSGCTVVAAGSTLAMLQVVENSASTEETLVKILPGHHVYDRGSGTGSRIT